VINSVLLQGYLDKGKLNRALEEIHSISSEPKPGHDYRAVVNVAIASDGGDGPSAVGFVEAANHLAHFQIKVYEASSTAAYIALALSAICREMNRDATLGIHRGEITLSPSQIDPSGKIDQPLIDSFKAYDGALVAVLKDQELGNDKTLMAELYASDWLRISAKECLRWGIVQRLF